jgi:hypothetical protein
MLNAGFRAISFNAVCIPLAAADVDDFAEFSSVVPLKGAATTIRATPLFSRVSPVSSTSLESGSVDTSRRVGDRWEGKDFALAAVMESLRAHPGTAEVELLVAATVEQIQWWTGVVVPSDLMRAVARANLP